MSLGSAQRISAENKVLEKRKKAGSLLTEKSVREVKGGPRTRLDFSARIYWGVVRYGGMIGKGRRQQLARRRKISGQLAPAKGTDTKNAAPP